MGLYCALSFVIFIHSIAIIYNENFFTDAKEENTLATRIRHTIMGRLPRQKLIPKKEICYDVIGCFDQQRKHGLKKSPQSPEEIDTQFWFYSRAQVQDVIPLPHEQVVQLRSNAELIRYGDGLESLNNSSYDPKKPLKVIIHGFKGSGKLKGALSGVQEFLMLEDANVLVVDWEKGAADSYPTAAANTELIGRQTAVMLLDMIYKGARPQNIHIVGFSLGAHIAGCVGDLLKSKGFKIGRITGLDPASPLFKYQFFRESSLKLDADDADFVDIVHTDGSPIFTDGFGILRPIGHVDFFPNGGREQPGCNDGRGSVVVSTLEGTINSSVACSHTRAWDLFIESMVNLQHENGCQFIGYPCTGGNGQFGRGQCFVEPLQRCQPGDPRCNIMGVGAYRNGARGVLYLSTRDTKPFCGEQLQATLRVSEVTQKTRGYLHMKLTHGSHSTNFRFTNELADTIAGGMELNALAVAEPNSLSTSSTPDLFAELSYQSLEFQSTRPNAEVFIGLASIKNQLGQKWSTCNEAGHLQYIPDTTFSTLSTNFSSNPTSCNV